MEVVDVPNTVSDDTPVPDSPISEKNISFNANHETPMPVLEPKLTVQDEQIITGGIEKQNLFFLRISTCLYSFSCSDSIRTIFFVTDQTSIDENNRSLTIEIDPMYLIEKDNNNDDYLEKIKYSTIKLLTNNEK